MLQSGTTYSLPVSTATTLPTYSRPLSDNEQSYYLQSRAHGANDMLLETEFAAPAVLVTNDRISLVWAILLVQHPLLASRVEMEPGNYHSCHFVYTPPSSPQEARLQAESRLQFRWRASDDTIGVSAQGERNLSSDKLSYIVLLPRPGDIRPTQEFRLFWYFAHCSTDGVAAHLLINAFFTLLGGSSAPGQPPRTDKELEMLLESEWAKRWASRGVGRESVLPQYGEARLPQLRGWKAVASKFEHTAKQKRHIGGHTFPRKPAPASKSVARMAIFSVEDTNRILQNCRAARVTFSSALFALCSMAWIRMMRRRPESGYDPKAPIMIYSAVSLRHLFASPAHIWQPSPLMPLDKQLESFVYLAVSYFNAVLPGFIPSSASTPAREAAVMWHRARDVRMQLSRYTRTPMFVPRVHHITAERGERARKFAKEDDEALLALGRQQDNSAALVQNSAPTQPHPLRATGTAPPALTGTVKAQTSTLPPAPSVALLGLSSLGNLDQFYDMRAYPCIDVSYIYGHTRKNKGSMLLFQHTFRNKLALQLGWDEAGFKPGVVEAFWQELQDVVKEYMIDAPATCKVKL